MAKKIVWTEHAFNERKEILEYWNNRNKSELYSIKLDKIFRETTKTISKFPKIGKPTNHRQTRIKVVRDYLMVYKEFENYISVISVWDARQNPVTLEKILE